MALRTRVLCLIMDGVRRKPLAELSLEEIRRLRRLVPPQRFPFNRVFGRVPSSVTTRDIVAPTRAGSVPARVYEAAGRRMPSPLVVFFHGGGWVQGSVAGYDALCAQVADRTGALVVSVDYRLAPEHVFPAALEDCIDVTTWAATAVELDVDPDRVAVMGDSAGGNLAAVVAQQVRQGGPRLVCQVLLYPATDATFASPSIEINAHAPVLTRRKMHDFTDRYLPDGDPTDPRISPLLAADLSGLPRTLIQTAELDPLRDDGARYAEALEAAGVRVRYTEYTGVPHGFVSFPGAVLCGAQSLAEITTELKAAFA